MIKFKKIGVIMKPQKNHFGSFARFNPGVHLKDGIVHMLYRASNSDIKDAENGSATLNWTEKIGSRYY